ncbi:MAG: TlpA disulfide reductase family protein [Kofleriaceae bacterium]
MAPAQNRTGVVLDARVLLVGGGLALVGVLVLGFFLWMVPNAAEREAKSACTGLVSQPPLNPALCPNGGNCKYPIVAPDFTAYDHNGKPVKLSDYRGKVVLLNFWASWCGVCETEKPHLREMAAELGSKDFVVIALASDRNWTDVLMALVFGLASTDGLDQVKQLGLNAAEPIAKIIKSHPKERETILNYVVSKRDESFASQVDQLVKALPAATLADALDAYKRALPDGVPFDVLLDKPAGDDNIGAIAAAWGIKAVPESALIDKQGNIRHYFVNKRDWQMPVAETCLRSVIDE